MPGANKSKFTEIIWKCFKTINLNGTTWEKKYFVSPRGQTVMENKLL